MRVHSWNPSFTPLQPVGREIEHAISIRRKALDAESPCRSTFMSAISISVGLLYCAAGDSGVLQDAQATTDRRVRITKDVPVLRIDHISIKGMLLGVWPVSCHGECDPDSRQIESGFFPRSTRVLS